MKHAVPTPASLPDLRNLGPKSRAMLAAVGVTSLAHLTKLGAVAAYSKVKRSGAPASLNLLWALEGALTGLPGQTVAREHRPSLLLALEATHFHRMVDELGALSKVVTQMALGRSLSTICSIGRRRRNHPVWHELSRLP